MKRPVIPTEFGAKVPTNIRQRYLNTFIDECVKFCPSEEAAFRMVCDSLRKCYFPLFFFFYIKKDLFFVFLLQALDEEKLVYDRSSSKNIYLNVAVNTLKKLRGKSGSSSSPVTSKDPPFPSKGSIHYDSNLFEVQIIRTQIIVSTLTLTYVSTIHLKINLSEGIIEWVCVLKSALF